MIKIDPANFKPSTRLYAIDTSGFDYTDVSNPIIHIVPLYKIELECVWFRLKSGIISAHIGRLWDYCQTIPKSTEDFLASIDTKRYGANCRTRWERIRGVWSIEDRVTYEEDLKILIPMLDNYPQIPDGFDGWWKF